MADREIAAIRLLLAARPRPAEIAERRQRLDQVFSQHPLPADVVLERVSANGVVAEWSRTPDADPNRVLLFLHGGGYISGSIVSHRGLVVAAGRAAAIRTLALEYRLAPEHPFPAAVEDTLAGFRYLLDQGFAPEHIAVAGDSAGGGLTLALMLALRDAVQKLPGCAWCISPWVDLEIRGDTVATKAAVDPMIQGDYLRELVGHYLAGADPRQTAASPLLADLSGLPPLLIQVGAAETLLADSTRLAAAAGAADVSVTLTIWPEMIHVWHLFHPVLAAGRRAIAEAAAFIQAHLATARVTTGAATTDVVPGACSSQTW
jgi:acetyl esterase/lipase